MKKHDTSIFLLVVWTLLGLIWFPVYVSAWLLHIVARILLAIAYLGLLNGSRAKDVFKSLFKFNPTIVA